MSKIHVLPDENLDGVLREYVEVDRATNVSVLDLLANLARRVAELERKLIRISGRSDYYAEELGRRLEKVEEDVERILDDIVTLDERTVTLDERTQPLVAVWSVLAKAVKGDE